MTLKKRPLVLMILDGFGHRQATAYNAIHAAKTPQWDEWWATCPHLLLDASGTAVGLPPDQMGNSEVGHMHISAGRVIFQELTEINEAIRTQTFDHNPVFNDTLSHLAQTDGALHVMGLLSDGGVHSHIDHLIAFLALCAKKSFHRVFLHLFLDGRDTPPKSALHYLHHLQDALRHFPVATIASLSGRYYAMDRDQRWERIEPVYRLITAGLADHHAPHAEEALGQAYQAGLTDEFIPPTRIGPAHPIQAGDACFFINFRADRARQLTEAFLSPSFNAFQRLDVPLYTFISMTAYATTLPTRIVFPKKTLHETLGEVIATAGLRQLRLAETEKYAHVTFFFNGGVETPFPLEERRLIPSPKVKTYDLKPEMSAELLTTTLIEAILSEQYDVIICNYANADMVGHTGDFHAAILAIEALDRAMQQVGEALRQVDGRLCITADHGNAECMFDEQTQQPHTAHTHERVPFLCVDPTLRATAALGTLSDVAPTVLYLLNLPIPANMTGTVRLVAHHA